MVFAKDRKVLICSLVILGLPLMVLGAVHHARGESGPEPGAQAPGPKPGTMMMEMAIAVAYRKHANGLNAIIEPEVFPPTLDNLGGVACWRLPFHYWATNLYGMQSLHQGAFLVKDGRVIQEQWD